MAESLEFQRTKAQSTEDEPETSSASTCKKNEGYRQVKLAPFGESTISFMNVVVASTKQAIDLVKREGNRGYTLKINEQGVVTIQYEPDAAFTIGVFNNSRWVTNLYIEANRFHIGNVARATSSQVSTLSITTPEARNVYTTFKIENRNNAQLKRLDVKGHNTTWFSIFSHNANMLIARPNGNWLSEKLLYLTDQMTTQAVNNYRRTQGQAVLAPDDTMVMQRQRQTNQVEAELNERKCKLQEENEIFEREAAHLAERKRQWQLENEKLERETIDLIERERLMQERKRQWQLENEQMDHETKVLVERGRIMQEAEVELNERKRKLKRESEVFEREAAGLAERKREVEFLGPQQPPIANNDQPTGNSESMPSPWSRRKYTASTLTDRFTNRLRVTIVNGEKSIVKKPTHHDFEECD